jgi:rhamnose utilization protein RhaD (predicted bifunctional aldolase and dehydrogenase)
MTGLDALVSLSRLYGGDPEWVLAGGGNSSYKEAGELYVKASGYSLAEIADSGFCRIDRAKLDAIWEAEYPEDARAREAAALADLMAARSPGESKRPSVETLMHGLFPQAFVVHTHPAAINGIACGIGGKAAFDRLFGEDGIWVPFVDPGYLLAKAVRSAIDEFRAREGRAPAIMLMQNHGFLAAGESPAEVEALSSRAMAKARAELRRLPDLGARTVDASALAEAIATLSSLAGEGACIRFRSEGETLARAASREAFAPLSSAFTPDHIVYAGHEFLLASEGISSLPAAWSEYAARNGAPPRIVLIPRLGAFACARGPSAAEAAMLLYTDAVKVAAFSESFGGASHMTARQIDFIRDWEVERYRSSVSAGG